MNGTTRDRGGWISRSLLAACIIGLTACAPAQKEVLPDDPTEEVVQPPGQSPGIVDPGPGASSTPVPTPTPLPTPAATPAPTPVPISSGREAVLRKYQYLDPTHMVPTNLLENAVVFFDANLSKIKNQKYLSIIDFAQPSNKRRFYIINMADGSVWPMPVAHGKGSDSDHDGYAEKFSNVSGSQASSLGYYLTAETYYGSNGLSLRLDGLSSTNSNARSRAIVIHGASYVQDRDVIQGRSWGCPAVPLSYRDKVISSLKGGSLIYAERSFQ